MKNMLLGLLVAAIMVVFIFKAAAVTIASVRDVHPFYKEDRTLACYWGCKIATSPHFNVTAIDNGKIYTKCAAKCEELFPSQLKRNVSDAG